jgi:hypothetical protein
MDSFLLLVDAEELLFVELESTSRRRGMAATTALHVTYADRLGKIPLLLERY